jgi:hypothetical protein
MKEVEILTRSQSPARSSPDRRQATLSVTAEGESLPG